MFICSKQQGGNVVYDKGVYNEYRAGQ